MRARRPVAMTTAAPIEQTVIKAAAVVEPTFSNSQTRIAPSVPMVTSGMANMRLSSVRPGPCMRVSTAIHPPISEAQPGFGSTFEAGPGVWLGQWCALRRLETCTARGRLKALPAAVRANRRIRRQCLCWLATSTDYGLPEEARVLAKELDCRCESRRRPCSATTISNRASRTRFARF